jgi:hypothetical protein
LGLKGSQHGQHKKESIRWYRVEWDRHLTNLFDMATYMDTDKVKMDYKNLKKRYESISPETIQEILETLYDVFLLKWMQKKLEGRIENVPPYTIDFPKMWKDIEKKPQWDVYLRCSDYMKYGVSEKMAEEYHAMKKIEFPESEAHFAPHVSVYFRKNFRFITHQQKFARGSQKTI